VKATRILAILLAAGLVAVPGFHPAAARADGDPASDVLLGENVFYPYTPPVKPSLKTTLNAVTTAAARAHVPVKVALIASPVDLGVIPDLFGHPQKYADFLDQEISFQGKQPLLVVMPAGYGVASIGPKARAAVAALPKPAGTQTNDLAKSAIAAVARIATAEGHPVGAVPGVPGAGGSSNSKTTLVIVLVVAALLVAGALAVLTLRRRHTPA
jgi:hypothetical protein